MATPKWAEVHSLEACGLYYQGFVSNYEEVLTQHRMCTVTSYGIRRSRTTTAPSEVENEPPIETATDKEVPKKVSISCFAVQALRVLIFDFWQLLISPLCMHTFTHTKFNIKLSYTNTHTS